MSEEQVNQDLELAAQKQLADDLGLKYHPTIGLDKLKEKIAEFVANGASEEEESEAPAKARRTPAEIKADALKLVRFRMTCMNPAKKEYDGEYFMTGNKILGTIKKYVPYNVDWHAPQIIVNMIKESQCQIFVSKKHRMPSGIMVDKKEGKLIKEYALEILPPLTDEERQALAQRQAMARGTAEA